MPLYDTGPEWRRVNDPDPETLPSYKYPEQHPYSIAQRVAEKPYRFEPYPKMLYRARRRIHPETGEPYGQLLCEDYRDLAFTNSNQQTVGNEAEETKLRENGEGWRESPKAAIQFQHDLETIVAREAHHRFKRDKGMSQKAKDEAQQAEIDAGLDHLPEGPRVKRPPRRRKVRTAPAPEAA